MYAMHVCISAYKTEVQKKKLELENFKMIHDQNYLKKTNQIEG